MIYGDAETEDGTPILNIRWPQRQLTRVSGYTESGVPVDVYVWDDCTGDAIDSALEWAGEEGSDDAEITACAVTGEERGRIMRLTDECNLHEGSDV